MEPNINYLCFNQQSQSLLKMPYIDPITDCKYKAQNVKTAVNSVIFDDFENLFLLENYLECLQASQKAVEALIESLKADPI